MKFEICYFAKRNYTKVNLYKIETKNFDKTHLFVKIFPVMNEFHASFFIIYKKFEKIFWRQMYIAKLLKLNQICTDEMQIKTIFTYCGWIICIHVQSAKSEFALKGYDNVMLKFHDPTNVDSRTWKSN